VKQRKIQSLSYSLLNNAGAGADVEEINPLTPNEIYIYICRTAPLTPRCYFLYI
jgi:hypothetical protein